MRPSGSEFMVERRSRWHPRVMATRPSERPLASPPVLKGLLFGALALASCSTKPAPRPEASPSPARTDILLTGAAALGDWTTDGPGVKRKITVADLPAPNQKESVSNGPKKADRPA